VLSKSLDGAAVDVQAAITQAARLVTGRYAYARTFTKVNPADQPLSFIRHHFTTLPLWTLDDTPRLASRRHLDVRRRR